jgi:hypothetical protein
MHNFGRKNQVCVPVLPTFQIRFLTKRVVGKLSLILVKKIYQKLWLILAGRIKNVWRTVQFKSML